MDILAFQKHAGSLYTEEVFFLTLYHFIKHSLKEINHTESPAIPTLRILCKTLLKLVFH